MIERRIHTGDLVPPIHSLECYFRDGGTSIVRAAFAHSYFVHPDRIRERTPYYPDRARKSKKHYPGLDRGKVTTWEDGRQVRLDVNQWAQMAWEKYTGCKLERGSGYGVRHIWGNPWNPDAYTAGWNLCYMPFWAGMLTEDQHQHEELTKAIQQASWELYFRESPVCPPPNFVVSPGLDLETVLEGQPLQILAHTASNNSARQLHNVTTPVEETDGTDRTIVDRVRAIKGKSRSWRNINKAALLLQGKPHDPFSTHGVERTAKSCVRKICRVTGLTPEELEKVIAARNAK